MRDRRDFIEQAGGMLVALSLAPAHKLLAQIDGSSRPIRIAVIGSTERYGERFVVGEDSFRVSDMHRLPRAEGGEGFELTIADVEKEVWVHGLRIETPEERHSDPFEFFDATVCLTPGDTLTAMWAVS